MAKRPHLATLARPSAKPAGDQDNNRLAELEQAVAAPPAAAKSDGEPAAPTSPRSREGKAKVTIHMSPEARDRLKLYVMQEKIKRGQKLGIEDWVIEAINEKLHKDKAIEWRIS